MAVLLGTYLNEQSEAIEEVLDRDVEMFLPELDPVYSRVVMSRGGEGDASKIGRDMLIKKTYYSGYSGVIDQAGAYEHFVTVGDTDGSDASVGAKLHMQNLTQTWPDATKGPVPSPIQMAIPMRASLTNLLWTLGEMQAEALPAYIASNLSPKLKGFAKNVAHTTCNYLYLSQTDSYQVFSAGTIGTDSTDLAGNAPDNDAVLVVTPSNLACARVNVGMRLWLHRADGTAVWSDGAATQTASDDTRDIIVTYVDRLKNKVHLRWADGELWDDVAGGSYGSGLNIEDDAIFVFPGTYGSDPNTSAGTDRFLGYAGFNSWMKDGSESNSNLLGAESISGSAIDIEDHPEFKSAKWNFNNAPLTEHRLRQMLRRFHAAHGPYGHYIDTLVASDGVWLAYERQWHAKEMIDRTGRLSSVQEGQGMKGDQYGGFSFTMDGRTVTGYTSQYVDAGTVYGTKTKDANWKLITPPDYSGLQSDSQIGGGYAGFRFVGPALQSGGGIKFPIYKSDSSSSLSLVTEGVQTPGMIRQQLVPDHPAGIKLTNVEEDRLYSDN